MIHLVLFGATIFDDIVSQNASPDVIFGNVLPLVWWVAVMLAVVYVAYGGFKYTTSNGDSNKINEAKSSILNGIIGLVVALITMFFLCGVEKSYAVGDANPDPLAFCSDFPDSDVCTQKNNDPEGNKVGGTGGVFIKIVNIIIYLTASLSILMVVIGAFKYVISGGEGIMFMYKL